MEHASLFQLIFWVLGQQHFLVHSQHYNQPIFTVSHCTLLSTKQQADIDGDQLENIADQIITC